MEFGILIILGTRYYTYLLEKLASIKQFIKVEIAVNNFDSTIYDNGKQKDTNKKKNWQIITSLMHEKVLMIPYKVESLKGNQRNVGK